MAKNNFWKNRKIFPSITTISGLRWKDKIREVKELNLKEVCLFLTCLEKAERKKLYKTLEKTEIVKVPLVHLRHDTELWEIEHLMKRFKAKVFNIHTNREYQHSSEIEKYKNLIYIENAWKAFDEEEIRKFAGICLDLSHLENERLLNSNTYRTNINIIEEYPCGCNHISAIKKFKGEEGRYDCHYLEDFSELDYLKRYPARYFSQLLAIELENSIDEQLKSGNYIIEMLKDKTI